MFALRVNVAIIAALIIPCAAADAAYIEFQPVQTYIIPGAGSIQYARFNDLDLDHSPEVLAIDTDKVVLYSPTLDSVLYSMLIGPAGSRQVIFDDVNRDGVPDVVEGSADETGAIPAYARINMVDGLSIWLGFPQILTREYFIEQEPVWLSSTLGFLKAADVNLDGKSELLFSYDTAYSNYSWDYEFGGITRCYYSFPDSLLWRRPQMFLGLWPLGSGNWLTSVYGGYYNDLPGMSYAFEADLKIYNSLGGEQAGITGGLAANKKAVLSGGSTTITYPKCIGNLIADIPGTEILASYSNCVSSGPPEFTYTCNSQLRMYNFVPPDSLEPVWQLDGVGIPWNVLAQGGFSGHYLGFQGNTLNLYEGASGSVSYSTTNVPAGRRQWCYPFSDSLPYLAVMNADTVALYSLAVSTAVDDGGEGTPVPSVLAIGAPHPNPFNAVQTISLKAKPGQYLTVDIFNLLGQKVATIFDGRVATAEFDIPWKADQLPSGIYFIRGTSGGEAVTVKSILIK